MADDIGEIMRKVRSHRGLAQEFVADSIGVDNTTYSRYERGETQPRFETVVALCKLFKMSLDEFYHFGNPDYKVESPTYLKNTNVFITVELDGRDETLQSWFRKLSAINQVVMGTA